jgi:hypothetical protein
MCFSAGASFTAGVLLTFVGTETERKVHKTSQILFASIPLFFAFQQFAEGVLWLTIGQARYALLQSVSTSVFLIMAQVLWPILVPLSVLLIEENRFRKKIVLALLTVGTAIALHYAYRLMFYEIHAEINNKHVLYKSTSVNALGDLAICFYLVATILPFFVSSIKRIYILGIIMGLSFLVSAFFYTRWVTSVWCFFAAVISFVVFYIIRDSHKKFHFKKQARIKQFDGVN